MVFLTDLALQTPIVLQLFWFLKYLFFSKLVVHLQWNFTHHKRSNAVRWTIHIYEVPHLKIILLVLNFLYFSNLHQGIFLLTHFTPCRKLVLSHFYSQFSIDLEMWWCQKAEHTFTFISHTHTHIKPLLYCVWCVITYSCSGSFC